VKLLRSWPAKIPAGRSFVVDAMPKLVLDGYDYAPLAEVDDDVLLLEWDIAVDRDGLERFILAVQDDPGRVLVAPYRLYVSTLHSHPLPRPRWVHRRGDGTHVEEGEPVCGLFGFGMTYFPRGLARRFLAERPPGRVFSDADFSQWHHRQVAAEVPIIWDVRPMHLHFKVGALGFGEVSTAAVRQRVQGLARWPDPEADYQAAELVADQVIGALLRERAGVVRQGKGERVAAINEQLALRGYKET
jgi:hypothetical protein